MKAKITGLGLYKPDTVRTNDAWPAEFIVAARARAGDRTLVDIPPSGDELGRITAQRLAQDQADPFLGAVERRVAGDMPAWDAEARAGALALEDAGITADQLDAVLGWPVVPDFPTLPPGAPKVAHHLGAHDAWAADVNSACASALLQLEIALGLVESGRARHVLATQSSLVTKYFPMSHPASPGIGDCATAFVVSAASQSNVLGIHARSHGEHWLSVADVRSGDQDPATPWWKGGGPMVLGSLNREGARELMRNTVRFGVDTVRQVCARVGIDPSTIDAVASVNPRGWMPPAIAEGLGLPRELAPTTYPELAHVMGCGVIANLVACRDVGLLRKGALVALYAQGAGFTRSAALLRW